MSRLLLLSRDVEAPKYHGQRGTVKVKFVTPCAPRIKD
jgi:hypothetical protein